MSNNNSEGLAFGKRPLIMYQLTGGVPCVVKCLAEFSLEHVSYI